MAAIHQQDQDKLPGGIPTAILTINAVVIGLEVSRTVGGWRVSSGITETEEPGESIRRNRT